MAYRLEAGETLPDGLKRIVREQLDDAIAGLRSARGADAPAAVHNARKDIKKTRSVLRLARDEIGEELYRHENDRLRAIANSLSGARDAEVLVETLGKVQERADGRVSEEAIARLRLRLEADRDEVAADSGGPAAMREAADALETVRDGVEAWPLTAEGFDAIEPGLRRIYKRGRARMDEAASEPTVLRLHEWRKRAKDLWYHSRILEPVWPGAMKAQIDAADELGELLGEDHDLAILQRRAGDHGDAVGSSDDLVALLESIVARRLELRTRAFSLGRRLYAEPPKAFLQRLETAWGFWREESAEPAASTASVGTENGAVDGLNAIDLHVGPHEASDLLPIDSREILDAHGWDIGFWAVLDDVRVERSLVAIGHRDEAVAIAEGWEVVRVRGRSAADTRRTEDAEALARHQGHVYIFGSHHGGKKGPLEAPRAFVARFEEAAVAVPLGTERIELEVAHNRFRLHRAVNDALREFGPPILDIDEDVSDRLVGRARRRGRKRGKDWAERVQREDVPLNVEGAAFRPDGKVLLGLRLPTTADGDPLLVELASVDPLFAEGEELPEVTGFWILQGVGTPDAPAGVRALRDHGYEVHVVTGSLDSVDSGSALLEEHPEGAVSSSTHSLFRLPNRRGRVRRVRPTVVRRFPHLRNVEGLSPDAHGRFFYVSDEDEKVPLRFSEVAVEGLVRDREGPDRTPA